MIKRQLSQKDIALLGSKEFCTKNCGCIRRCKEGILTLMNVFECDRPTVIDALKNGTAIETEEDKEREKRKKALSRTRTRNFKKERKKKEA